MSSNERSNVEFVAAMEAAGWGKYLVPERKPVVKQPLEPAPKADPKSAPQNHQPLQTGYCLPDGKRIIGRDLGAPGVLPASELLRSRNPRSDHRRGR